MGLPVLEVVPDPEDRIVLLGTKSNAQGVRVCMGLLGKVGKQVACSIYGERPELCRQFEAGSSECHQARRATGVEPNSGSLLCPDQDLRTMGAK